MKLLIQGGHVIDPGRVNGVADVLIDNGATVTTIALGLGAAAHDGAADGARGQQRARDEDRPRGAHQGGVDHRCAIGNSRARRVKRVVRSSLRKLASNR